MKWVKWWAVLVAVVLALVKCDRALGLLVLGLVKWRLAVGLESLVQWERALVVAPVVVVLAPVGSGGQQWLCLVTSLVLKWEWEVKWEVTVKWECGQWVVKWVVKWTP